ncbi:hypothetical protein Tco_0966672, partial [Tanacetum coccineum]
ATKRPLKITFKRKQNPLHAKPKVKSKLKSPTKHAPKPEVKSKLKSPAKAKPSPPLRNPILRSAKHAPPPANPKPKAPKLKASDVTEFDQGDSSGSEEGDGSDSEEEGNEEEDEKEGDDEEDEEEGDEEEDEKEGDDEEDEEEGDEEEDEEECDEEEDEENGDEEEDEGEDEEDAIVKDEEYEEDEENVSEEEEEEEEKNVKKDSEPSSSEDEKPLKKKTKGGKKGKGPSKPMKKVLSDNNIRREKFLSDYLPLLSRTVPSSFFHVIRDVKVNMKRFMEDIGFSAFHLVNIDMLPNRLTRFVVRAFDNKTYNFYLKIGVVHVTPEKFAPKKKKEIFATDITEKLVCSTRVDFMFKVNFLMLFANVMGKVDTMKAFVNLSVVRRIREDTNIAGVDWCDFIHRCLAISHEPNTDSGFYNVEIEGEAFGKLEFYGEWSENEIVEAEGFCEYASVLPHTDKKIICEMIEEKLSSISKEKAEETILLEEAKAQKAPQNVKPKSAAVNTKEAAEKPKPTENVKELAENPKEPAEKAQKAPQNVKPKPSVVKTNEAAEKPKPAAKNVKELAEKPKEPAEKAQKAPQNVKPKPAAVKTKEAAEKPKPAKNVKELAEKPKEPAKKAQKAPQNVKPKPAAVKTKEAAEKPKPAENVKELAEKPKEPTSDDYQVVRAATVMKDKDRKEFEVKSFT